MTKIVYYKEYFMKDKDTNKAFVVSSDEVKKFLSAKIHTANDAINRIENRKKSK